MFNFKTHLFIVTWVMMYFWQKLDIYWCTNFCKNHPYLHFPRNLPSTSTSMRISETLYLGSSSLFPKSFFLDLPSTESYSSWLAISVFLLYFNCNSTYFGWIVKYWKRRVDLCFQITSRAFLLNGQFLLIRYPYNLKKVSIDFEKYL